MKFLILTACLFLAASPSFADGLTLEEAEILDEWVRTGPELRFRANDLFGHINGGAELFLEFGFKELRVQRFRRSEVEISVERYRMDSPEAALGIYLMKCGSEKPWPELSARHSASAYQLTLVMGDHFVLVNNFSGEIANRPAMLALSKQTIAKIPDRRPKDLFAVLPAEGRVPGSERLLRGPFALEPFYTFGPGDILDLKGELFGVLADYEIPEGESFTQIVVVYPDRRDAAAAFNGLREGLDPHLKVLADLARWFSFQDYQQRFGFASLEGPRLVLRVRLAEAPVFRD